jgi:hypothetical protein
MGNSGMLKPDDLETVVGILARQALSLRDPSFFHNWLAKTNLEWGLHSEAVGILHPNPEQSARSLIQWSLSKENVNEPELTVLGSLLRPILQDLGVDHQKILIELIIRYCLYKNRKILIQDLKKHPNLDEILNNESTPSLIAYANSLFGYDSNPISPELTERFIRILVKIKDYTLTVQPLLATFGNPEQIRFIFADELDIINDDRINIFLKVFVLLKLLLEDVPYQDSRIQSVIKFSRLLQPVIPDLHDDLQAWLQEVEQHGYFILQPAPSDTRGTLEAHLMIIIRPANGRSGKIRINGFLRTNYFERWNDVDFKQGQWGYGKDSYTLKEAEHYVADLIHQSEKMIDDTKVNYHCNHASITIEFFMPYTHLHEKVGQWQFMLIDEKVPIGTNYKTAIRSYERVAHRIGEEVQGSATLLRYLEEKWDEIQQLLKEKPTKRKIRSKFACLCHGEQLQTLNALELKKQKIGLKLSCSPPRVKEVREKFFKSLLQSGIPIAIWVGQDKIPGIDNLEKATDQFLQAKYLANLNLLLEDIQKENHWAEHLVILCDDPTRLPSGVPPFPPSEPLLRIV